MTLTVISLLIVKIIQQKVCSDFAENLDEGSMTAFIMLDLSAAFDVIDHQILLKHLEFRLTSRRGP